MAVIFYLSGTGNSLYAAKSIAQELEQCRLEGITGYLKAPYEVQDEVVGIVCPVYCMALPPVVEAFLQQVKMVPQYIFLVVTMGAMSGQALGQGKELLKQRELRLSYGAQVALPDNSIVFPSPQARQEKLLRNAPAELGLIARNIKNKYDNYKNNILFRLSLLFALVFLYNLLLYYFFHLLYSKLILYHLLQIYLNQVFLVLCYLLLNFLMLMVGIHLSIFLLIHLFV